MKTGTKRRIVAVRLDDELIHDVDDLAKKSRRDRSDFIRVTLENAIEESKAKDLQEVGK